MKIRSRFKNAVVAAALLSFLTAGCFGPFSMTRGLGAWNATIGNKWEVELLFVGLVVVHAYSITSLIDLFILNPIFFWKAPNTGSMWVGEPPREMVLKDGRRAVLEYSPAPRRLRVDLYEQDRWIDAVTVGSAGPGRLWAETQRSKDRFEARVAPHGGLEVWDPSGRPLYAFDSGRFQTFTATGGPSGVDAWVSGGGDRVRRTAALQP